MSRIVAYFEEMTLNLAESGGFMTEPLSVEMEEFVFHGENVSGYINYYVLSGVDLLAQE